MRRPLFISQFPGRFRRKPIPHRGCVMWGRVEICIDYCNGDKSYNNKYPHASFCKSSLAGKWNSLHILDA
uniref:Uncharacterized protein n=1 Tax=Arundo donax TaxID=35708 RepID=A0A0A9DVY4_ARUDO